MVSIFIFLYNIETETWNDPKFPPAYSYKLPLGITNSGVIVLLASSVGGMVIATPTASESPSR